MADARSTWMRTSGNPVHEFVTAAIALCPPDLSLDVTIDNRRRLTGVFAGALPDGHRAACGFAAYTVTRQVDGPFDVVLTTNGGYRSTATSTRRSRAWPRPNGWWPPAASS